MSIPTVFGDITVEEQATDLRCYFKNLGAEISEERSPKGIEEDVLNIIEVCDVCFNDSNESDMESVLNSIVSLLVMIPDRVEDFIIPFCEKLSKGSVEKNGRVALKALWLLFQSLEENNVIRYHVYCYIVKIAQKVDMVRSVFRDIPHLKKQFAGLSLTSDQMQKLLRLLHDALVTGKQCDMAAKIMVELLSTYTSQNADTAKEDAKRCIITALADPSTFLLDPLLALKPIKALEGELVYKLFIIFVSEKLSTYLQFHKGYKDFIKNLGLDHNQNIKKMRILTFMQLAEISDEISFETIQKELSIQENEVEAFIIEVLKTKLVKARMNQPEKKVLISSTMHRTFGLAQWQQLREILQNWKSNLTTIDNTMRNVVKTMANRKSNSITSV